MSRRSPRAASRSFLDDSDLGTSAQVGGPPSSSVTLATTHVAPLLWTISPVSGIASRYRISVRSGNERPLDRPRAASPLSESIPDGRGEGGICLRDSAFVTETEEAAPERPPLEAALRAGRDGQDRHRLGLSPFYAFVPNTTSGSSFPEPRPAYFSHARSAFEARLCASSALRSASRARSSFPASRSCCAWRS